MPTSRVPVRPGSHGAGQGDTGGHRQDQDTAQRVAAEDDPAGVVPAAYSCMRSGRRRPCRIVKHTSPA